MSLKSLCTVILGIHCWFSETCHLGCLSFVTFTRNNGENGATGASCWRQSSLLTEWGFVLKRICETWVGKFRWIPTDIALWRGLLFRLVVAAITFMNANEPAPRQSLGLLHINTPPPRRCPCYKVWTWIIFHVALTYDYPPKIFIIC